jgi:heat shock protein HtpX
MYLLVALMFAIFYAIIAALASVMGITGFLFYGFLAIGIMLLQYMIGPKMVEFGMRVKYVSKDDYPKLHKMVEELAKKAKLPMPKVGISQIPIPNAFAFGRWKTDSRVCVTEKLMDMLDEDELRAVLGHEMSHIKHHDVAVITTISVVPMICWYAAWSMMFSGGRKGNAALIGLFAFVLYFITNLLVLYGSRIREYYADEGSIELGNEPHSLASALYKLVYGSAKIPRRGLKSMEGYKAFFVNDPTRAMSEIRELKAIDKDMSGTLDKHELDDIRHKKIKLRGVDHAMELLSTHPNMLKRISRLSKIS